MSAAAPRRRRCLFIAVTASLLLHAGLFAALACAPWQQNQAAVPPRPIGLLQVKEPVRPAVVPAEGPALGTGDSQGFELAPIQKADVDEGPPIPEVHGSMPAASSTQEAQPASSANAFSARPQSRQRETSSSERQEGHGGVAGGHGGEVRGWFAGAARAQSVVFVLDRSLSMGLNDRLKCAQREVSAALRSLPPTTLFQVLAYNDQVEPLRSDGRMWLLLATPENVRQTTLLLTELKASCGTNHVQALRRGLALHPQLLILVTDGVQLNPADINEVVRSNDGHSVIDVVEIGAAVSGLTETSGQALARRGGGVFKRVAPE
jgi:hypothetical protein